jgi:hypothetical protein
VHISNKRNVGEKHATLQMEEHYTVEFCVKLGKKMNQEVSGLLQE